MPQAAFLQQIGKGLACFLPNFVRKPAVVIVKLSGCVLQRAVAHLNETADVDSTNHTGSFETVGAAGATCAAPGYTGDLVCAACGTVIETGHMVEKTGEPEPGASGGGKCVYCGETHTGWIGLIVAFIHSILHMILQLTSC